MDHPRSRVLAVSGSLRRGSTNAAVLQTAVSIALKNVDVDVYTGLATLPHFTPDDDHDPLPEPVVRLRAAIARSDAVVFSTPEYAGTLPGAFKNLLDWTVGSTVLTNRRVAWINVAPVAGRGTGATDHLAMVLGYVGAEVVADACAHIPVSREMISPGGLIDDSSVRAQILVVLERLVGVSG
jgi:chromate reductase, NAD(P)H dehydrogenase (quinone)